MWPHRLSFAILIGVALPLVAAPVPMAPPDLKWKFAKDDTFYIQMQMEMQLEQTVTNGGGKVVARAGLTAAVAFIVQARVTSADDKETTVEVTTLTCKQGEAAGGAAVKLADEPTNVGLKVTLTLDKAHRVTKVVGADKLITLGNGFYGGSYLQTTVGALFLAVPGKPLGKGETWASKAEGKLADEIVANRTDRGTVAGTDGGLTKLEVESDHAWDSVPFVLKGEKGKRGVLFDAKRGRVRKVTDEYSLAGEAPIGGGQNTQVNILVNATTTVTDDKPEGVK